MTTWIVSSAVLILVMILLRYALRGRIDPRLQYALWALVLLRLLIPGVVLHSPISVEHVTRRIEDGFTAQTASALPPQADLSQLAPTIWLPDGPVPPENADLPMAPASPAQTETARVPDPVTREPGQLLRWVWYGGMAVIAAALLGSNLLFYLRLRRCRKKVNIIYNKLQVYVCESLSTPCMFGPIRPSIYITPELAKDGKRLEHVLSHEYTHYRHGDHWWSLLRGLCLVLHWYDPLVWWAAVLSRRDAEAACDAGALRLLGEEARDEYGRTLIGLTVARTGRLELLHCATTMTGGKRALRERVQLIAKKPKMRAALLAAVLCVTLIAAGCAFTGAGKPDMPAPEVTPEPSAAPEVTPDQIAGQPANSAYQPDYVTMDELFSAVYDLKTERADEFVAYDYLSQSRDALLAGYDGSEHCKSREWTNEFYGTTMVTDTVYFWRDATGQTSANKAASVLVEDMLKDIQSRPEEFTYTLTRYRVPDSQTVFDWYDILCHDVRELWNWKPELLRSELPAQLEKLVPGEHLYLNTSPCLPIVEDLWLFNANYCYAFEGEICEMYGSMEEYPKEFLTEDGLIAVGGARSLENMGWEVSKDDLYVLMKCGDVWMMQSLMTLRNR